MKNVIDQKLRAEVNADFVRELHELQAKGVHHLFVKTETVAKSGISRTVAVYLPVNNFIVNYNSGVARLIGETLNKDGNITLKGCGMDMHYWLVNEINKLAGTSFTKVTL